MKVTQKELIWDQVRSPSTGPMGSNQPSRTFFHKLLILLLLSVTVSYIMYTVKLVNDPNPCDQQQPQQRLSTTANTAVDGDPFNRFTHSSTVSFSNNHSATTTTADVDDDDDSHNANNRINNSDNEDNNREETTVNVPVVEPTNISHIVFGIGASSKLWQKRKNYIKIWYDQVDMRGVVWVEDKVKAKKNDNLPEIRISENTDKFPYSNKQGHRSAIRISRVISETLRLGLENVRWFVLGDDDTVFVTENLIRVLQKYDHTQYWYIGSNSESHLQNIYFSYAMAYGGGGFAISYPLAVALEKMQDRCIQRYPALYGSDDRMQACMAELGVPLTKELGFHQYDVYGNLFGLLAAHPVTPLVSLHHLDVVEPIFPNVTQVQALQRLTVPMKLDSAGLMQQSVCYEKKMKWTISVSWGFAVQIVRGILSPREMEMPTRTFLNWYKRADYTAYAFNTRPVARNPCQKPFVYYLSEASFDEETGQTVSVYLRHHVPHPLCRWKMVEPSTIEKVVVYKKPDPELWSRSPRRNCCRILNSRTKGTMELEVGVCREDEVIEI